MTSWLIRHTLHFKVPFRLSHGIRTSTEAVALVLKHKGSKGHGEATFPPYLPETADDTVNVLEKILPELDAGALKDPDMIGKIADEHRLSPFTRNILVNALIDLYLHRQGMASSELFTAPAGKHHPPSTFTLTKNDPLNEKLDTARHFSMLKLKLDGRDDLAFARRVMATYKKPFCADANEGWSGLSVEEASVLARELRQLGCTLIEQPFGKNDHEKHAVFSSMRILPVYADEGIQNIEDFRRAGHCYDGVNIKLLKCGGIDKAWSWAQAVRKAGKKIIVGCMSESSCGCAAALVLKPLADYLDLDGPWLISNDPFTGLEIHHGELITRNETGFGIELAGS